MYFSISQSSNSRVERTEQLAALPARQFGANLIDPTFAHIPFESCVAAVSHAKSLAPELVAREIVGHDAAYRAKAFRVGAEEALRSLGGEEKAMQFFANAVSERNTLRFESVGGISDDVNAVKNRLASSSMDAYFARQMASTAGVLPEERDYIDLLKVVRSNLETGIERGKVSPSVAEEVVREFELASLNGGMLGMREIIRPLQEIAREELFEEQRKRVMQRYSAAPSNDGPALDH